MQFKLNICGNSKNPCSPLGSTGHFPDDRPRREREVTYSGPALFGVRAAASRPWLGRLSYVSRGHLSSQRRLQVRFARPSLPGRELCLSCSNELQSGISPEPSLISSRGPGRESWAGTKMLLSDAASSWCLPTGWHTVLLNQYGFPFSCPGVGRLPSAAQRFFHQAESQKALCSLR